MPNIDSKDNAQKLVRKNSDDLDLEMGGVSYTKQDDLDAGNKAPHHSDQNCRCGFCTKANARKFCWILICGVLALPTAYIAFLSAANIPLENTTLEEIHTNLSDASAGDLTLGTLIGIGALYANAMIAYAYLYSSLIKTLETLFPCENCIGKGQDSCTENCCTIKSPAKIALGYVFVAFAVTCSLFFAQLSKDTLGFLNTWSWLGFGLNGMNYLITRIAGMFSLLEIRSKEYMAEKIIRELLTIKYDPSFKLENNESEIIKAELGTYLRDFFSSEEYKQSQLWSTRDGKIYKLSYFTKYFFATILAATCLLLFVPRIIGGLGSISNHPTLWKSEKYYNWESLLVGIVLNLPTPNFYIRSCIYLFPRIITAFKLGTLLNASTINAKEAYGLSANEKWWIQFKCYSFIGLNIATCCFSGYTLWGAARSIVKSGYLGYLGVHENNFGGYLFIFAGFLMSAIPNLAAAFKVSNDKMINEILELQKTPKENISRMAKPEAISLLSRKFISAQELAKIRDSALGNVPETTNRIRTSRSVRNLDRVTQMETLNPLMDSVSKDRSDTLRL